MTAKQYLRQGYKLNMRIQDKQERLAQFKELAGQMRKRVIELT